MAKFKDLPNDKLIASKIVDAESTKDLKMAEMGALGWLLGDVEHKPANISFCVIIISFIGILSIIFINIQHFDKKWEAVTLLSSIITGALGFIYGRSSS